MQKICISIVHIHKYIRTYKQMHKNIINFFLPLSTPSILQKPSKAKGGSQKPKEGRVHATYVPLSLRMLLKV